MSPLLLYRKKVSDTTGPSYITHSGDMAICLYKENYGPFPRIIIFTYEIICDATGNTTTMPLGEKDERVGIDYNTRVRYQDKLQLLEILFTEQPGSQELNIVKCAIILIVQGFTEQPSGQELNIVKCAIILIIQGFTEQPSGQELNIVTSAIILIVQGFTEQPSGIG